MDKLFKCLTDPGSLERPLVMGILNITPDSFHDGGRYFDAYRALLQARLLAEEGADIIDIGAASSRPGYTPVSAEEELYRLLPILAELEKEELPTLSVDTDKLEVAAAAVEHGVMIINDTSGDLESGCFELAASKNVPLIVMHRQAGAEDRDIVSEVEDFFKASLVKAAEVGLSEKLLILDPGLGFNKSIEENNALIDAIPQFRCFGRPLLIGYSHKRFAAAIAGESPGMAPLGNAILAEKVSRLGAEIVRVHDVRAFLESVRNG